MKGLELAERYYNEYGRKMIDEEFPEYAHRIAVGLVGEGSECLGYDDEISEDHDFEPGFCLFITAEDERKFGFKLERAYAKLPKEFMGYTRQKISPVGGSRHGVFVVEELYRKLIGIDGAPDTDEKWLSVPSHRFLAATSGKVFKDDLGVFSKIREEIKKGYPERVRRQRIADCLLNMAQTGQYNYERCVKRGETGAAGLAISEFIKNTVSVIYLINNMYEPFYKWAYRGMRELPLLSELENELLILSETKNGAEELPLKLKVIEEIAEKISKELHSQGISRLSGNTLHAHAYSVLNVR